MGNIPARRSTCLRARPPARLLAHHPPICYFFGTLVDTLLAMHYFAGLRLKATAFNHNYMGHDHMGRNYFDSLGLKATAFNRNPLGLFPATLPHIYPGPLQ